MHSPLREVNMLSFLLALAPAALAADMHDLSPTHELPEGTVAYTAGALVRLRADFAADAPVVRRLAAGTRVRVVEQVGDRVEVTVGGARGFIARELLSTMGRTVDLDGDGVEERVVVALDAQGRSVAWLREGAQVQQLLLFPYADPYLGDWDLVPADTAGVPLLRVGLGQDACGAFPTSWLSFQDGTFREALGVVEVGDGGYSTTYDVRFDAPGQVSIHAEEREDGDILSASDRVCALTGGVYSCG
jgi:hypothetical protein